MMMSGNILPLTILTNGNKMKKTGLFLIGAMLSSTIAGCSTPKPSDASPEYTAGGKCAEQVLEASKNKNGTTQFTSLFRNGETISRVGDTVQTNRHIQGIPYVEASALDNGNPGSAWRNCMWRSGFSIGGAKS